MLCKERLEAEPETSDERTSAGTAGRTAVPVERNLIISEHCQNF